MKTSTEKCVATARSWFFRSTEPQRRASGTNTHPASNAVVWGTILALLSTPLLTASAQPSVDFFDGTVYGESRDGRASVGVGSYPSTGLNATLWTAPPFVFQNLGWLVVNGSPWRHSDGYGASLNGGVVFGWSGDCNCNHGHAFRWTTATGIIDLGTLAGDLQSAAGPCSDDGNTAIGWSQATGCYKAVVWRAGQGFTPLGTMSPSACGSLCSGISADGTAISGNDVDGAGNGVGSWLWSQADGFRPVGSGVPNYSYSLSGDGSVVVGIAAPGTPYRWSSSSGMQLLGTLPGASDGYAYCANWDGTAVAGDCAVGIRRAFLWTSSLGLVDLTNYLQSAGVDVHGRILSTVRSMSSDGSVLWGVAYGGGSYRVSGLPCVPYVQHGPRATTTCLSGAASLSVQATGVGPLTYRWQWQAESVADWTDLLDGINSYLGTPALDVTGATESALHPRVLWGIGGNINFRCIVSNACGSVTSNPATLTICVADTDDGSGSGMCDGGVTIDDLLYYLREFEDGATASDVDDGTSTGTPDGGVTIDDLLYYLQRFEAGC